MSSAPNASELSMRSLVFRMDWVGADSKEDTTKAE